MRVLVAPDSFKGSLGAAEAAEAMCLGVLDALPGATVECCPLADGGEGTATVLLRAMGGDERTSRVTGPLGQPVQARWGVVAGGGTAVIEMAEAAGLALVPATQRDPTRTTTYGVGQLVRAALDTPARRIIVGVGGSATTDGGAGAAQALGVRFAGGFEPLTGGQLKQVQSIDVSARCSWLDSVDLVVACDVDNPLFGPEGAAGIYAPQKGADADGVWRLEQGLRHLAQLLDADPYQPGAGAAGGLAFGLAAMCGARLVRGADLVFDAVGFDERLAACDWVLTGEGTLDVQSLGGKVVGSVAHRAARANVPVAVVAGAVDLDAPLLQAAGVTHWSSLCEPGESRNEAMERAALLVRRSAAEVARALAPRSS